MKKQLPLIYAAVAFVATSQVLASSRTRRKIGFRGKTRAQKRRAVQLIYEELGLVYFKRSFRMSYQSFCELSELMAPTILRVLNYKEGQGYRTRPNGRISPSARLACALRYFAGGDPYDIMLVFLQRRLHVLFFFLQFQGEFGDTMFFDQSPSKSNT
jgi:hypothetical protein